MYMFSRFSWFCTVCFGAFLGCLSSASAEMIEYTNGHADIGLGYTPLDGLFLHYHFGVGSAILDGIPATAANEELSPSEAYVRVADSTKVFVQSSVPFLSLNANDPAWILSQSNVSGQPFLGIAAEELLSTDFTLAGFRLTGFRGPVDGQFALFGQSGFTTNIFMQTNNGINPTQDFYNIGIGSHDHANFGFTKEGVYDLDIQGFASGPAGSFTDSGTFRFVVGSLTAVPEPSSLALLIAGSCTAVLSRRRLRSVV